jgi:hypothetical protein
MSKPSQPLSDLEISFTGLCLFVPEPASKKTYVFLVETRSDRAAMVHEARLYVTNANPWLVCKNSYGSGFDLTGCTLDFSSIAYTPSAASNPIPGDVPLIAGLPSVPVAGAVVKPDALPKDVVACIVLPPGEVVADVTGTWTYRTQTSPLATCVRWRLTQISEPNQVQQILERIGAGDEPIQAAPNQISLMVVNVPGNELPGNTHPEGALNDGDEPPHFAMFYKLTDTGKGPRPTWAGGCTPLEAGISCPGQKPTRGSFIRCMVAQLAPVVAKKRRAASR